MQEDLTRLRRRKRRLHKIAALLFLCVFVALSMVVMRSCSDQFSEPYNKDYQPMDTERKQGNNF